MFPKDVASRMTDRIFSGNTELNGKWDGRAMAVWVALANGPIKAREISRHETINAPRELDLFSKEEWQMLLDRANKLGIDDTICRQRRSTSKKHDHRCRPCRICRSVCGMSRNRFLSGSHAGPREPEGLRRSGGAAPSRSRNT